MPHNKLVYACLVMKKSFYDGVGALLPKIASTNSKQPEAYFLTIGDCFFPPRSPLNTMGDKFSKLP